MSVDGYIAGPNGEMDWMVWTWDDELKQYISSITDPWIASCWDESWHKVLYHTGLLCQARRVLKK